MLLTREDTARRGKGKGKGKGLGGRRRGRSRVLRNADALVAEVARSCGARIATPGLAGLSFAAQASPHSPSHALARPCTRLFTRRSFGAQLQLMRRTDVLVGPHGAGLTHILHLPPHAGVVELTNAPPPQPGRSVANIYRTLAQWTGHPYRAVHGAEQPEPQKVATAVCGLLPREKARPDR